MRKKLICVVGETKSGKDNTVGVAEFISKEMVGAIPLNAVVSYTTRPKRDSEENGREHFFISEEKAHKMMKEKNILAYTKIEDPESGAKGYEYFTTYDQLDQSNIYIIDPNGLRDLKKNQDLDILTVYIHSPKFIRRFRARKFSDYNTEYKNRVKNEEKQFAEFRKNKEYNYKIHNIQWFSYITGKRFFNICQAFLGSELKRR